jgi:hypothetical protein
MKQALLIATAAVALSVTACNRHQASVDPGANNVKTYVTNPSSAHNTGRLVSAAYSQPIAIDSANKMIGSYLSSVGYPYVDSTIRSLSFDADSIRAYLQNTNITTLKFYLAHQLTWIDANTANYGKNIGMQPGKLTLICVGLDDNGAVVRNTSNGVYEHAMPCPNACGPSSTDAYLQ